MHNLSAIEIREKILKGERSAEEVTRYFLKRAESIDHLTGALLSILSKRALQKAKQIDRKREEGKELGKLAGIPIVLKDNIQIHGERTTCGSKFLEKYVAPFDATVTRLIDEEDGIIIAKANLDEFAMGSSNEFSAYKKVKNPWDLNCVPGGSSGGSACSVASMLAPLSLGSDTGGSVRQPASFCGIYGFKPTYGRVSRFGLVAFGSSLDQIGPFARTVEDIALLQEVLARPCEKDSTSVHETPEPYLDHLDTSIQGKKIGVPYHLLKATDPDIADAFEKALSVYESLGVEIVPIELKLLNYSIETYYILSTAEASTNLARFDGIRYTKRVKGAKNLEELYEQSRAEGFGKEVKQRIFLGTYVLSAGYQDAFYRKAQKVRSLIIEEYQSAFKVCDIIALPTSPSTAFESGSIQDPIKMYQQDIFTISANLTGVPALSMPVGFDQKGKPIGMQLQAPQLADVRVLRFAHHFAKETNYHTARPSAFDQEVPA